MSKSRQMSEARCLRRHFINKQLDAPVSKKKSDPQYWKPKILEYVQQIRNFVPPRAEYTDGDMYTGTPGIAYLFYCLMKSPLTESQRREFGSKGMEYIWTAEMYIKNRRTRRPTDRYGFLIGDAGFHAIAAVLYFHTGNRSKSEEHVNKFIEISLFCNADVYPVPLNYGANELFVGRSGYLLGSLWMEKELKRSVLPKDRIYSILNDIVREGRQYSVTKNSAAPLMYAYYDTEYIGAAHGVSSIMFTLLSFPDYLAKNKDVERDVKATTDWILSTQTSKGNFPAVTEEIAILRYDQDHELVHWCHGAPGVVYLMAKAYLYWKDKKYLESCVRCGELVWQRGLLKKGPGICHGIAGNAYVFLLLYRLTGDEKYIHRANVFAEFTQSAEFRTDARQPDAPFSLYEGIAGALCFLLDLFQPDQATFPFMEVF